MFVGKQYKLLAIFFDFSPDTILQENHMRQSHSNSIQHVECSLHLCMPQIPSL